MHFMRMMARGGVRPAAADTQGDGSCGDRVAVGAEKRPGRASKKERLQQQLERTRLSVQLANSFMARPKAADGGGL